MIPWTLLASARIPGDGGEVRLYRRGEEYSIRVGAYELMNSRVHGSEDALAELVCARLQGRKRARILIGGLGMGFTLAAVERDAAADAEIVVSELVPEVVAWNRRSLAGINGRALSDKRVRVREEDVSRIIVGEQAAWDAIILDVDNGPAGLTSEANDRLYSLTGLRAAASALRPKGVLAVWSAGPQAAFTRRLQQTGFEVEEVSARARAGRGARFVIWIARPTGPGTRPHPRR